jgi:two-component system, OmpR family, response regulator CpxR
MRSIAIFPCSYTYGASVIGELSNALRLRVYTDEMLFADVSGQFGVLAEKLKTVICYPTPALNRYKLKKKKYVNMLLCSLEAHSMCSPDNRLYYGLHTTLLDIKKNRVLRVLVSDEEKNRVRRAMQQEGFTEKKAKEIIRTHDKKVSEWTRFLVKKEAYDQSMYDVVIPVNNRNPFDITTDIVELFKYVESSQQPLQRHTTLPVLRNRTYMENQMSCAG